jgi:hypothetical protein
MEVMIKKVGIHLSLKKSVGASSHFCDNGGECYVCVYIYKKMLDLQH